jgi:ribosomal protein L40E
MSTKICYQCSSTALVHLISLDQKICSECGTVLPWKLDPGQVPLFGGKYEKEKEPSSKILPKVQQISKDDES